jgi:hypothetical protein
MKQFLLLFISGLVASFSSSAQQSLAPGYITNVPAHFKNCGTIYTHDSISLQKKKYILLTDLQNLGMITIRGKQIKLLLTDTKTVGKINTGTYTGEGYAVVISYQTISQGKKTNVERGTLKISKGNQQLTIKIHGLSGCDESKQEGNGE